MEYNRTETPQKPQDFLVWAILCTCFCCLPLGIVSIIRSCQVNTYWGQGAYDEAYRAAKEARKWAYWGIGISAVFIILYLLFIAGCIGLGVGLAALG